MNVFDVEQRIQPEKERLSQEFAGIFSPETVEAAVLECYQQLATTATVANFLPTLAERFARDRLRATAQVEGKIVSQLPEVLFVCVHNAGRSQMAAALLDRHAHGKVHVLSAGSQPASTLSQICIGTWLNSNIVPIRTVKGFRQARHFQSPSRVVLPFSLVASPIEPQCGQIAPSGQSRLST